MTTENTDKIGLIYDFLKEFKRDNAEEHREFKMAIEELKKQRNNPTNNEIKIINAKKDYISSIFAWTKEIILILATVLTTLFGIKFVGL